MSDYPKIKDCFESKRDEKKAIQMAEYMRNQFDFYGIQAAERRICYKNYFKEEKKHKNIDWDFLDRCWDDEYREFQYAVKDYLLQMQGFLVYEDITKIEKYIRSKQWWDTIDGLDKIVGSIGLVDERVDGLMLQWSIDEDFWVRRVAIDHQLGRKDRTKADLLKKIILNNLGSEEFFINKAIGWSLREYSKTNPEWVRDFIASYRDKLSILSIKEGSKYI